MMKRLSILAILLAATLALSACAEQSSGQFDEEAAPPEPTQAESEAPANGEATTTPKKAPDEGPAPEDDTSSEDASSEDASSEASSGPSATTIQGEEVSLGGGGDVTALFFMAGW